MRSVLDGLRNGVLFPLLGWAVLGMVVDVVAGPLAPETALGILCKCAIERGAMEQPDPAGFAARPRGDRPIVSVAHDSVPFSPPAAMHDATWPNSMIAPDSAPPAAITAHAGQAVALLASPSFSRSPRGRGKNHDPGGEMLSLQLCRLHC